MLQTGVGKEKHSLLSWHLCMCVYMWLCVCAGCRCKVAHMHAYASTSMHMYIYNKAYIHTYAHVYMHAHPFITSVYPADDMKHIHARIHVFKHQYIHACSPIHHVRVPRRRHDSHIHTRIHVYMDAHPFITSVYPADDDNATGLIRRSSLSGSRFSNTSIRCVLPGQDHARHSVFNWHPVRSSPQPPESHFEVTFTRLPFSSCMCVCMCE